MIIIRKIDFRDTFDVRHPVLRKGKPIESCFFDGDDLPTTKHFGAFDGEKLTGVISVYQNKNATFNKASQYQIRGMAVLENFQKKGIGEQLVLHSEQYLYTQNAELIWFNAREKAVAFYEKMNYEKTGNCFEIPTVGPHYLMYKKIG